MMQPAIHAEPSPAGDLGGPALRAFFALAERWKLRPAEQRTLLGEPPESTYFKWKKQQDGSLSRDVIAQADAWVRKPNDAPLFGGQSALERMLSGNVADLYVVRQYLDAQRGWNG